MPIHCPCCGQPTPEEPDFAAEFSGMMLEILAAVMRSGRGVTMERLVSVVYGGHPDGGPLSAKSSIMATISRHRRRLHELGFEIYCTGHLGEYRLRRVNPAEPFLPKNTGGRRRWAGATGAEARA